MEMNNTINRIIERVRIEGIGALFRYDEITRWNVTTEMSLIL